MSFDTAAWKKAQMQVQDAKMQTSTYAPIQQMPGGGFVSEVSPANAVPTPTPSAPNHATRRRNKHRLAQAMAVHSTGSRSSTSD